MIKVIFKLFLPKKYIFFLKTYYNSFKNLFPITARFCPICNYKGYFYPFGRPPRNDAQCPSCHSLERHRLIYFLLKSREISLLNTNAKILHFAPELFLKKFFSNFKNYITADIEGNVDRLIDIENIEFPEQSFDLIIVNHVFEHVDDIKAIKEINRILKTGGYLITSVPIIYGWSSTYENKNISSEQDRIIHFGQHDHKRYYGSDFVNRILKNSSLKLIKSFSLSHEDEIKFGLIRGEKIFLLKKITKNFN